MLNSCGDIVVFDEDKEMLKSIILSHDYFRVQALTSQMEILRSRFTRVYAPLLAAIIQQRRSALDTKDRRLNKIHDSIAEMQYLWGVRNYSKLIDVAKLQLMSDDDVFERL